MQKNQPPKSAPPARPTRPEKRALRNISLSPPEYRIDPQNLLDYYIEKEITYAGRIENVPVHEDVTNRTNVLRTIDNGKRQGKIAWKTSEEHRAIFTLSVYNIKISRRHTEEVILRVTTHEIAAICYVRDDKQHILALKYGDPKTGCQLAVMHCDSKGVAEEICALVGQCFQLVYTDATMQFIDQAFQTNLPIPSSSKAPSDSSTNTFLGGRHHQPTRMRFRDFLTHSSYGSGSYDSSSIYRSLPGSAGSDTSSYSGELLQDYVKKLHKLLTSHELKKFAQLLTARHSNVGLSFKDFCDQVRELFGNNRKQLMAGLWPFIGDRDSEAFEDYLGQHGITISADSGLGTSAASSSISGTTVTTVTEVVPRSNKSGTRRSNGSNNSSGSGHSGGRARLSGDVFQTLMNGLSAGYNHSLSNGSNNSDTNSDTLINIADDTFHI